jgi:DNA-binding MarR family transcriptional regulator
MSATGAPTFDDRDYEDLLALRDELRRFLHWSEDQARAAGLTPAQHQLLLAVRGHRGDPTIGELAAHLLLRHHSAVELVDRAQRAGLVRREVDREDHRVVRVRLTAEGADRLAALAATHLVEIDGLRTRLAPRG